MRNAAVMTISRRALFAVLAVRALLLLGGCASFRYPEPIHVVIAGVEPLESEGLEVRMLVKLRIQNPNDSPLEFNGVSIQMDVQGKRFATGVSDAGGNVPRFGEALVGVPVSISVFGIARQAIDVITKDYYGKLAYEMTGQLAGPAFTRVHFTSKGEFTLPAEVFDHRK
jgi:LEA14-like dessication related protein